MRWLMKWPITRKFRRRRRILEVNSKDFRCRNLHRPLSAWDAHQLVEGLLAQTVRDGMLIWAQGVDAKTKEPFMRYFGLAEWEEDKRKWWDMVSMDAEEVPAIFAYLVSLASFRDEVPFEGTIPVKRDGVDTEVVFRVVDACSFELSWPASVVL